MLILPDLITNTTQVAANLSISSVTIPGNRSDQCQTIGYCRTIWEIIWTCLATLFAFSYAAIHPNIPQPKPPSQYHVSKEDSDVPPKWSWAWLWFRVRALRHDLKHFWRYQLLDASTALGQEVVIVLLALLMPEFIFEWALKQWLSAREIAQKCRDAAATEKAGIGRKLQQDSAVMGARAEFEELNAISYSLRTPIQHQRRRFLSSHIPALEQENAHAVAAEVGEEGNSEAPFSSASLEFPSQPLSRLDNDPWILHSHGWLLPV